MRRLTTTRAFVASVVILAMLLSITMLFGAPGSGVKITAPAAKAKVKGVVTIEADVRTSKPMSYALLVVDNDRPGATNSLPCSFDLDTRDLADGPHRVTVEAYDDFGLLASSKTITLFVNNHPAPVTAVKRPATATVAKRSAPVTAKRLSPGKTVVLGQSVPARTALEPASASAAKVAGAATSTPVAAAKTVRDAARLTPSSSTQLAEGGVEPALAPMAVERGPAPEPTRTAAAATLTPRASRAAEGNARMGVSASTRTTLPPVAKPRTTAHGHTVFLNGHAVEFDVVPVVTKGRLHGGFRALFAHVGGQVSWTPDTRTARSVSAALTVEVPTGSRIARVNGAGVDMGAAAQLRDGRTIIPVRFFAEITGAVLVWDKSTGVAHLRVQPEAVAAKP